VAFVPALNPMRELREAGRRERVEDFEEEDGRGDGVERLDLDARGKLGG
jgi:hypothetical protein